MLALYNLLGVTVPNVVAKRWGVNGTAAYNSSPWHSILAGIFYVKTENGIIYSDDFAKEAVQDIYPEIVYNSDDYYDKCKELTLETIYNKPLFVIKGILLKYKESVKIQMEYLTDKNCLSSGYKTVLLGISLFMVLILTWKKQIKRYFYEYGIILIEIVMLAELSLYTGVLTVPNVYYQWGAVGAMGILVMFVSLSLLEKTVDSMNIFEKGSNRMAGE